MASQRTFLQRLGHAPAASSEEVRELMGQTKTHQRRRAGVNTQPTADNAKIWRADQRPCTKEYAPGTRVRCNTLDLKVLKEGE